MVNRETAQSIGARTAGWLCRLCFAPVVVVVVATTLSAPTMARQAAKPPVQVGIDGFTVLKMAIHKVAPTFPLSSLKAGVTGVVVARVLIGSDGQMQQVEILESPDGPTANALTQSLMQWRFEMIRVPQGPAAVRSEFAFYFIVRKGKPLVLDWIQMAELRRSEEPMSPTEPVPTTYPTVDQAGWKRMAADSKPTLLDIRKRDAFARGHLPGAINISERELSMRAPAELSRARPLVVDCAKDTGDLCSYVARILQRSGFSRVWMLNRN
jgi:rhodanese-related sulfurtransferase